MVQVLLPARLLQEAAACAVLGAALGAARAFLPVRGRAAFAPDVLLSGAVLLACQSYAAGYSAAGVLRWYMAAAHRLHRKLRRNAERTAKKSKKNLPNQRALLYNSNVSK